MSSQLQDVVFDFDDISLKEKPVRIGDKRYILREASGEAGRIYKNAVQAAIKYGEDGEISSITGMADTRTLLLSHCLIEADSQTLQPVYIERDGKSLPKFVHLTIIRSWPTRISEPMVEWVKTVSELSEPDTVENIDKQIKALQKRKAKLLKSNGDTEAKNELNGTMVGSE
jgi:hypothetical protein